MDLVIDANVVIALLINPKRFAHPIFSQRIRLFSPELLRVELEKKRDTIREQSRFTDTEIATLLNMVQERIQFVPIAAFIAKWEEAEQICPDPDDLMYFALALQLRCPIWSNDKKLKEQKRITIYATHELVEMLGTSDRPSDP